MGAGTPALCAGLLTSHKDATAGLPELLGARSSGRTSAHNPGDETCAKRVGPVSTALGS